MNGFDANGRIIIDAYAGEAMNPEHYQLWRDWCSGHSELAYVVQKLEELPYFNPSYAENLDFVRNQFFDDDNFPFNIRNLTDEEREWSDQAYTDTPPEEW